MLSLFERFPRLEEKLPHLEIAALPTPVENLPGLSRKLGIHGMIKRDDLTARPYGGNKVRKLEFLLAEALSVGAGHVLTFGCAGSNHATATGVYARRHNLKSISMLFDQPNARSVRINLKYSHLCGIRLHHYESWPSPPLQTAVIMQEVFRSTGVYPYVIPPGGSSPVGTIGFVNAGIELARQVRGGEIPYPHVIYVAAGTLGTCAGLRLGLDLSGMETRVEAVQVTGEKFASPRRFAQLYNDTGEYLASLDSNIIPSKLTPSQVAMRNDQYGGKYAQYTPESVEAVNLLAQSDGIKLEGTYTGKAMAALLKDAREGLLTGKNVLFWNTYNSADLTDAVRDVDYQELPSGFHKYFTEPVQPLDEEILHREDSSGTP